MKRARVVVFALLMVLLMAGSASAADIKITAAGQPYQPYPAPLMQDGVIMAPVSTITDVLDIEAKASAKNQTLSLWKNDKEVLIDLQKSTYKVNGSDPTGPARTASINNRTYVPLLAVAETLGAQVSWDAAAQTVDIRPAADRNILTIFHAGSLKAPMADLKDAFIKTHPRARIYFESSGSLDCARKVTEQGRKADLIASADYAVFDQLMIPSHTDWYAMFAKNDMVLCYTDKSKFAAEVNADNWYEVLTRSGVTYAHTNPDLDPAGYRSLMVWQLAEKHYQVEGLYEKLVANRPSTGVYDSANDLIAALKDNKIDYAFEYMSVAKQNGFKVVNLPEAINLSSLKYADFYTQAKVTTVGSTPGTTVEQIGQPIVYAITVPNNAPNPEIAYEFAKLMLGSEGQAIMDKAGQTPIAPAQFNDNAKIPVQLK